MTNHQRHIWAVVFIAVILPPTGYAFLTRNWLLAAICVVALLVVRFSLIARNGSDRED
jgi:hypothetical protein